MICSNCGSAIDDKAAVCVHCGVPTAIGMTMNQGVFKAPGDPNEPAQGGFIVLSLLVPICGIIFGATEKSAGRDRASKTYFTCAFVSMGFWLVFSILITLAMCLFPLLIILLDS